MGTEANGGELRMNDYLRMMMAFLQGVAVFYTVCFIVLMVGLFLYFGGKL